MDEKDRLAKSPISRRDFAKAALAIGGPAALSACLGRELDDEGTVDDSSPRTDGSEDEPTPGDQHHPTGPSDLSALPERQHAWNDYLVTDPSGNTVLPQHQLLLFVDYVASGRPRDADRRTVESVFETLESALQWGTGTDPSANFNRGLLFMIGYSPHYFDRFGTDLPDDIGLQTPSKVLEAVDENPKNAEEYDAVFVMGADDASLLLEVEEALFGNLDAINGVPLDGSMEGVFERSERRTGFVGSGLPHDRIGDDRISESAPQSMGFRSGFSDNQATEDRVSIDDGPFRDGTTLLISRLHIDLDGWYDRDELYRAHHMFSPEHSPEEIGEVGEQLAADSNIDRETADAAERHAKEHGKVGHTQKVARGRDDNFKPQILRRSEGNATDVDEAGSVALNFTSVQRRLAAFVETRQAMNGDDLDVADAHNGIMSFLEMVSRATFLVPPRRHRSLPRPRPE
jgi:hypothetical protein